MGIKQVPSIRTNVLNSPIYPLCQGYSQPFMVLRHSITSCTNRQNCSRPRWILAPLQGVELVRADVRGQRLQRKWHTAWHSSARPASASVRAWHFDSVLRGALDSARSLTGARYGVMTILDDAGRKHCFLSSKVSGEEGEWLWLTREGLSIFQSLTGISEPLRLPGLAEPVWALGSPGSRSPCRWGIRR